MGSLNYEYYHCTKCNGSFPFESIKYNEEKNLVCVDCHGKSAKNIDAGLKSDSGIIKFICVDCRYHFSLRKDSKINRLCPYCGKGKLMVDDATADKLIDEASKDKSSY